MANHNETFQATIEINSKQAQSRLKELQAEQKKLLDEQKALYAQGTKESKKQADAMQKDINRVSRDIKEETRHVNGLNAALKTVADKTYKDLRQEVAQLNRLLRDGSVKKNSEEWNALAERIKAAKREMKTYEDATKEATKQQNVFQRLVVGLNTHWGAITQIIGAITGLTVAIRSSVKAYADMEEAMADTRKYTGLTDEAIRDLNEDLKKMDTRTSREELNELAGAAGRLGKTSKQDILEFVEAGNMIKVALGDDLGEGAIDNVGKLAMAFGEDERMGLRGAMLATGSAVNELAQNSSAKAGYLVDFTARVAGFGKQLGLTQAQIMGFGAVMDENLLRDEMAATAFGNMLTKMQTDTEKFARIAGMGVKEFTDLLNKDANAAILALADSLKQADPQSMMKMLDDMGLDGNRAVGVLSTMADKIDDVRQRQQLATEAYKEATSVQKEYNTMNNTVEAGIEKAKKQFQEMTVELGERLMPIVKYTISSASLFVRILNTLTSFVFKHKEALAIAAVTIATYTAYVKLKTMAVKADIAMTKAATIATQLFNGALKLNPIGLLVAGLTAAVALFVKYRDRIEGANEAMGMLRSAAAKLLDGFAAIARQLVVVVKWVGSLYDKFGLLRWIIGVVVANFAAGFSTISNGVKLVVEELDGVGKVLQGIFTLDWGKVKEGFTQTFKGLADAAVTQFHIIERQWQKTFSVPGPSRQSGASPANPDGISEIGEVVVTGHRKKAGTTTYTSAAEQKKQEAAAEKARKERLEKLKEADRQEKAITDTRLAENMLAYQAGLKNYREYVDEQLRIQQEGFENRMKVWGEDTAEYAKYQKQLAALMLGGDNAQAKLSLMDYERIHVDMLHQLERDYQTSGSAIYRNEAAYREARFQEEMDFLENKKSLTREGSLERMQIEWEIDDRMHEHQLENERYYQERVRELKATYLQQSDTEREQMELNALDDLHKRGLLKEEEYQRALLAIKAQYANGQTPDQQTASTASDMLKVASSEAAKGAGSGTSIPIIGTIQMYSAQLEKLKELYGQDAANHEAYLEAKKEATKSFLGELGQEFAVAYQQINQILSATSSYFGAQSDYEVAMTKKKYEKQIEAAGNNQKKVKKLQEKQAKEEAAIKTKYNRKQMVIQMAQAVAQTAVNALQAYGAGLSVGGPAAPIIAAAFAAMATAAGLTQVAAIKKQHETQQAGYYEGGFTGGRRYRKEAGVVHEGEFVANHQAVNNPNVLPMLEFLDQAQRNNTVGRLTADDISRQLGPGGGTVVAPVVNVQTDNEELRSTIDDLNASIAELNGALAEGIAMRDDVGTLRSKLKHFDNLKNRG
ncbi:MAG: phage tail tape measure protein [Prevotella sp.]|nr:phage tail tape measure protein [Prevotella sp.]